MSLLEKYPPVVCDVCGDQEFLFKFDGEYACEPCMNRVIRENPDLFSATTETSTPRLIQKVLDRVKASPCPLPLQDFPEGEAEAVKALIAKGALGVTADWKVWPSGQPLPTRK